MRCPVCDARLVSSAELCPRCNTRLRRDGNPVVTSAQPTSRRQATPEAPRARGPTAAASVDREASADRADQAAQQVIETRVVEVGSMERDRETRIVEVALPAAVRRAQRQRGRAAERDVAGEAATASLLEQLQDAFMLFYGRLQRLDRLSWWVLLLVAFGVFLPWYAPDGAQVEAGIEGSGLVSVLAVAVALSAVYARTLYRRLARRLMVLQLGATLLVFASPLRLLLNGKPGQLRFGILVTGVAAFVALVLALLRLTRLESRPGGG